MVSIQTNSSTEVPDFSRFLEVSMLLGLDKKTTNAFSLFVCSSFFSVSPIYFYFYLVLKTIQFHTFNILEGANTHKVIWSKNLFNSCLKNCPQNLSVKILFVIPVSQRNSSSCHWWLSQNGTAFDVGFGARSHERQSLKRCLESRKRRLTTKFKQKISTLNILFVILLFTNFDGHKERFQKTQISLIGAWSNTRKKKRSINHLEAGVPKAALWTLHHEARR